MPDDTRVLYAYEIKAGAGMPITPATADRAWMDATAHRFAYRCLPLVIANQCGWFIGSPAPIRIRWTGGDNVEDLQVELEEEAPFPSAVSHFGHGVLTFRLPYLFRTPPGLNLWARGPSNWVKDGIQALEGIVETDWATATFTMNWKMTRADHEVRFERGEPICMIVPMPRGLVEELTPRLAPLESDPALRNEYHAWKDSRGEFLDNLGDGQTRPWQKHYHRGQTVTGFRFEQHQTKLDVKPFSEP